MGLIQEYFCISRCHLLTSVIQIFFTEQTFTKLLHVKVFFYFPWKALLYFYLWASVIHKTVKSTSHFGPGGLVGPQKQIKKAFIGVSTVAVNKVVLWKKKGGLFWCEVRHHLSCFEAPRGVFDNIIEQCFYEWAPVLFWAHGHAHACAFKWHGTPSCQWIHTIPLSYRWW